ncbi:response regulator [Thalassotalea euphylliae]|uniref:Sensory/regulatory protein RpfC n=1 Tax=Thalassotalea euphylliae TaxID=1655234 RepID=A0A3E0TQG8_9GAMM|nr:hybrid sensor histidine kinase/response regulator [Thalassotalea euphylliae]REL26590.1 response regulator [Thalassotalea euphylliae]
MTNNNKQQYKRFSFWTTLKFRVPFVSVVIAIFVVSVMSLTSYLEGSKILQQHAEQDLAENAEFVSAMVKRYFEVNFEDAIAITNAHLVEQLVNDETAKDYGISLSNQERQFNAAFASLIAAKPKFVTISLLADSGKLIAAQHSVSAPHQQQILTIVRTRPEQFKQVKDTYFQHLKIKKQATTLMITVNPLFHREKHVASLVVAFDLSSLHELLTRFYKAGESIQITDGESTLVYQSSGLSIANRAQQLNEQLTSQATETSESAESLAQHVETDLASSTELDNTKQSLFERIKRADLSLNIAKQLNFIERGQHVTLNLQFSHDGHRLFAAFTRLEEQLLLFGLALALIAFVLSIIGSRRMIAPLTKMISSISHYETSGDTLPLPTTKKDETGRLARSFERLLKHVEAQKASVNRTLLESQDTSAKLQSILNSIADAVVNFDVDGNILAFNRSAERMFGYRAKDMIGNHLTLLLPHDTAAQFEQIAVDFSDPKSSCRSITGRELPAMRKDGEVFPMLLVVSEVITEQGLMYTGLIRDNTYYKLLESERKSALRDANELAWRLDFALSAPQIGVWEYNRVTGRVSWDKRMYSLYGYEKSDGVLPEQIWLKAVHPKDREIVDQAIERSMSTGEDFNLTFRILMPDNQVNYIEAHAKAIVEQQGDIKRLVGTNRNVTEQRLLHDLKQEALDMAQESLRLKSEFLASMSHEIRTPMNGVMGMLGLLEQSELSTKQRHYVQLANSSAFSLLNLINDILDFSKVEAGKLELEVLDFDLRAHLGDIVESMAIKAQEKGVELILDVSQISLSMVKSDPTRLRQIITNLVGNAIKFTERGEVVIRAKLSPVLIDEQEQLKFECQVIDTGIGIAESKLGKLFDSFTQVDASTTRRYGGTGLGLAIVKKLCQLMTGSVAVESSINVGSQFTFDLVMQRSEQTPVAIPEISFVGHHILVVDVNSTNREVLAEQLSVWGASVVTADSGQAALAKIEQRPKDYFEVAILDRKLDDIDGVVLGQQLKKSPQSQKIKLIMMTSMNERGDASYFAELGYSAYFPKPATTSDLRNAMAVVLNSTESEHGGSPLLTHYNVHPSAGGDGQDNSLKGIRILLVEDNRINQAVVQGILGNCGGHADIANHGREALTCLVQSPVNAPYDIILMDCQMPEMDGYQTTEAIRAGKAGHAYQGIPIIAMTANAMKGDKEKCLAAGMNDYLSKPIDADKLGLSLSHWVKKAELSDEINQDVLSGQEATPVNGREHEDDVDVLWDKLALFKRVRNNEQLVRNLVELYVNEAPELFDSLAEALAKLDKDEVLAFAHKLKGSSNNLGGLKLGGIALQIEQAAKAGNHDELTRLTTPLSDTYQEFMTHLSEFLTHSVEA